MKKLYILFFLTIGFLANAQIINFPDANLKAKLLSANSSNSIAQDLLGNYIRIDTNLDGNIQLSEALNVSYLDISFSNIYSLEGKLVKSSKSTFSVDKPALVPEISPVLCSTALATPVSSQNAG